MSTAEMEIVRMGPEHVPGTMILKEAAGWNQLPQDWLGYLELAPSGCFAGVAEGRVVASGTAINYGTRLGWIGMILVHPEFRRRGLATRMMDRLIEHLTELGCSTLKLDATDAGAPVYEKLGFQTQYQVERWIRTPQRFTRSRQPGFRPRQIDSRVVASLGRWDSRSFGADRSTLLEWFRAHGGPSAYLGDPSAPEAFILGRPGSFAHQIGPLTASSAEHAEALLAPAIDEHQDRPLIADLISDNNEARRLLQSFAFEPSRVLKRMYRGSDPGPGQPEQLYCLAGFEFG
jgi:GNAT superfamily N-acetyltransferase